MSNPKQLWNALDRGDLRTVAALSGVNLNSSFRCFNCGGRFPLQDMRLPFGEQPRGHLCVACFGDNPLEVKRDDDELPAEAYDTDDFRDQYFNR